MPFSSPISKYVFLSSDNIKHCNSSKLPSHHNFGQVRHVAGHGVGHISAKNLLKIQGWVKIKPIENSKMRLYRKTLMGGF